MHTYSFMLFRINIWLADQKNAKPANKFLRDQFISCAFFCVRLSELNRSAVLSLTICQYSWLERTAGEYKRKALFFPPYPFFTILTGCFIWKIYQVLNPSEFLVSKDLEQSLRLRLDFFLTVCLLGYFWCRLYIIFVLKNTKIFSNECGTFFKHK